MPASTSPASARPRSCCPPAAPRPARSRSCAAPTRPPGTIKSGGATRRAAKMVVLDVDHPDIEEFVETKAREEDKIRALRDAGFDMDLGGKDITSVQYQNANNSVRVTDEFMRAVEQGTEFGLRARSDRRGHRDRRRPRAVAQDRGGRVGVRRPRHPVRRHHQRLAHQPRDRPDHRVQPVLGVHVAGQLVLQPGVAEPAEVPHATTTRSTRRPSRRSSSWSSPRWTSRSASPTSRPRRSATPPASTASSASATPTSARC